MKTILLVHDQAALTVVGGLPLLTRALCTGHRGGVTDWLIISQIEIFPIQKLLTAEPRLQGLSYALIDQIEASEKLLSNWLGDAEALLLSCTAVFNSAFIRQALTSPLPTPTLVAFLTGSGQETGVYRGTAACLWPVLRTELHKPPSSPAFRLPSSVVPIHKGLWAPLTLGRQEVERRLFASLGRDTDGFLARALDRKVSRAITRRLAHTRITPNQMTAFSFALGLLSVWLLIQPHYWPRVCGAAILLVSTTIDGCDGELARLKFLESDFGAKFDLVADNIVHLLLFPGIAVSLYRETPSPLYITLAFVTLLGVLCSMAVAYVAIFRSSAGLTEKDGKRTPLMELYERITGRDFAYILLFLALFDRLAWFLWAVAIGAYVFAGGLLLVYGLQEWKTTQQRDQRSVQ
jgi:phosphatidylglycerophosphate synthase